MDALQHLPRAGAGGGKALTKDAVLALEIGQPKLEVEGAKVRPITFDDGLLDQVSVAAAAAGREIPSGSPNDDFQLSKGRDLRPNAVGRQAQPPGF
jgi:hypothetical protein